MAFGFRWLIHGEAVPSRPEERRVPMATEDGWEIEDYTRIPYPEAWNNDPADAESVGGDADDDEFGAELLNAANAWFRAVELLVNQGFDPDACEAEIMRRCAKVSRHHRATMREIDRKETAYGRLAADESVCSFPWGKLCPEHGNTLREGRRGTYCAYEGCELRWPVGHSFGHCDLPAVVVIPSRFKIGEWRLRAGHRRMFPAGPVLRTLPPTPPVPGQPDGSTVVELRRTDT
jgi:hypothetical protein